MSVAHGKSLALQAIRARPRAFWITRLPAGGLIVPQNGTFVAGRNAAKRAARAAKSEKSRKPEP